MAVSKQNNNTGGIPKLSAPELTVSTINAKSLIGSYNGMDFVPGQIESAYGPGQGLGALSPGNWFNSNEVLRIMKSVRFLYETPDIQAYFVALIGAAGSYTWGVHHTHFDIDITIDSSIPGCGGIYESHVHNKGAAFDGLEAYGQETNTDGHGTNMCAKAIVNYNDFVPPFGYGPPILYRDFVGPGGSAGADLEWSIIMNDYGPRPDLTQFGYPTITYHSTGADTGAGIDLYHLVDPGIICDGRTVAEGTNTYPTDAFSIAPGYTKPATVDWTLQQVNWQDCSDQLMSYYPQDIVIDSIGKQHLPQPTYDSFQIVPSIPEFLYFLIPLLSEPYFGTSNFTIYILAQPLMVLPGDSSFNLFIDLAKAQKYKYASRIVYMYVDSGYLKACGCGMSPGLVANTVNVIAHLCDQLADCGFKFGGEVDFVNAVDNVPNMKESIDLWLQFQPASQPEGPTTEDLGGP